MPGNTDVKRMHALCIAHVQNTVNMCVCLQLLICPCRKNCCSNSFFCINVLQCLAMSASWADASKKTSTDTHSFVAMLFISSCRIAEAVVQVSCCLVCSHQRAGYNPTLFLFMVAQAHVHVHVFGPVCSHQHVCLHGMPL